MRRCIALGKQAKQAGESPVGSVLVKNHKIIGEGTEAVNLHNDMTFHAEIVAIREACQCLGNRDLSDCVLYTTHEPCLMCSYVIRQTKIKRVVFGLATGEIGGYSSQLPVLKDTTITRWSTPPEVQGGILTRDCRDI